MDGKSFAGFAEPPVIGDVHRKEWRHVEILFEAITMMPLTAFVSRLAEHIAMALVPGGIGYLRDDGLDMSSLESKQ